MHYKQQKDFAEKNFLAEAINEEDMTAGYMPITLQ